MYSINAQGIDSHFLTIIVRYLSLHKNFSKFSVNF